MDSGRSRGVAENLYAIASAPRTLEFVAVGTSRHHCHFVGLDGASWVDQTNIMGNDLNDLHGVTYGAGHYVAVGASGTLLTSTDGVNWIQPNYLTTGNDLNAVAYGDGLFVAVGDNGWTIMTGEDAINWTSVGSPTVNNLDAVTYGDNGFVAVGGG